jgi:hypothetical protein
MDNEISPKSPGRPRKSSDLRKANVTFRIANSLRSQLDSAARMNHRTRSEEIELRLETSFRSENDEDKAPTSNAKFARNCSYVAKRASAWAGALLLFPERETHPEAVASFLSDMRQRLEAIEQKLAPRSRRKTSREKSRRKRVSPVLPT